MDQPLREREASDSEAPLSSGSERTHIADRPDGQGPSTRSKGGDPGLLETELDNFQEREKREAEEKEKRDAKKNRVWRKHPYLVAAAVVILLIAIVAGVLWYLQARHWVSTDDAFVQARPYSVSPRITGTIIDIPITDNQLVEAGAVLVHIDENDYKTALDQANARYQAAQDSVAQIEAQIQGQQAQATSAQAQVDSAKANRDFAVQEQQRSQQLLQNGAGTVQREQQTRSSLQSADATVNQAQAALEGARQQIGSLEAQRKSAGAQVAEAKAARDQAELNLSYTTIRAAQRGRVSQLTAAKGQYVAPGQALMSYVPDHFWVVANFKETQIDGMQTGQEVDMTIDAYPGRELRGHIDSIQSGSGTAFSLLPAENATGNYVKVVQRVPVKIVFDDRPQDIVLGPGMSVVPKVRVR